MVRSADKDYLQNFRFRVFEVEGGAGVFANEAIIAGFNNITLPNITIEAAEHRTGTSPLAKKQGGIITVEDCTMTRGIVLGDTTMYDWLMRYRQKRPYRTDLEVRIYDQAGNGENPEDPFARKVILRNCIPTSVKVMGDLDASASDMNIQEITCALEDVELVSPPTTGSTYI